MRLRRRKDESPETNEPRDQQSSPEAGEARSEKPSATGTYLTDGRSLFRIQHTITEADGLNLEEPLLELEDCATLELILCSAGALERLGLRAVSPAGDELGRRSDRPGAGGTDGAATASARL